MGDPLGVALVGRVSLIRPVGLQPNRAVLVGSRDRGDLTDYSRRPHAVYQTKFGSKLAGSRTATGVMVHYILDEGVDDGPVIDHVDVPLHPGESLDALTARMHAIAWSRSLL